MHGSGSARWCNSSGRLDIHVIPAIPTSPVRPESGHSANARIYECTAYGAAENKSLEIKTLRPRRVQRCQGQHARGVVSFPLRTSRGRGV